MPGARRPSPSEVSFCHAMTSVFGMTSHERLALYRYAGNVPTTR
jgi:hypothetical protein